MGHSDTLQPEVDALRQRVAVLERDNASLRGQSIERLSVLSEAAAHLLAADDPEVIVRGLFASIRAQLGIDAYFHFMVSPEGDHLVLASCAGIPEDGAQSIRRLEFGQAICGTVAKLKQPITATYIQESCDPLAGLVRGFGIRVYACTPLMAGGRLLGTLSFASTLRDSFTEDELAFIRTLCHFVELAIERARLTAELRRADDTVSAVLRCSPVPIWAVDSEDRLTLWNPAAERLYGWTEARLLGRPLPTVPAEQMGAFHTALQRARRGDAVVAVEGARQKRDGARVETSTSYAALRNAEGDVTGVLAIDVDMTEQNSLERQVREKQKLESIGLLASGIAHDFNNILVGIIGRASLAAEAAPTPAMRRELDLIMHAGERAAGLTRQLLAYAGTGRFVPGAVDISELVEKTAQLIEASIPRKVSVVLDLAKGLPAVEGDPSRIQQLIMNLLINAAEAIEPGASGRVRARTALETVSAPPPDISFASDDFAPGVYVCLEVSDTGCGMGEETKSRIFDPFFTTKFTGRGLGLAAAIGTVRTCRGAISVTSAPGQGSTFRVLLPGTEAVPSPVPQLAAWTTPLEGEGTILFADDEEIVRQVARAVLERCGYKVLLAADGREAVHVCKQFDGPIAAVVLDLTMPVMDGAEALPFIRKLRPEARVLLTSGHDETQARRLLMREPVDGFLQKPFAARALAEAVRQALGSRRKPGRTATVSGGELG